MILQIAIGNLITELKDLLCEMRTNLREGIIPPIKKGQQCSGCSMKGPVYAIIFEEVLSISKRVTARLGGTTLRIFERISKCESY